MYNVTLNNDFVVARNIFVIICCIKNVTYDDNFCSVMLVGIQPDSPQPSEGRKDAQLAHGPSFFLILSRRRAG